MAKTKLAKYVAIRLRNEATRERVQCHASDNRGLDSISRVRSSKYWDAARVSSGLTGLDRLGARRRLKLRLAARFAGSPNR